MARLSDRLTTPKDREIAEQIANLHGSRWSRKRREALREHVLDTILHIRLDATSRPLSAEELGSALNRIDGRSPR